MMSVRAFVLILAALIAGAALAQQGVSSAASSRAKYLSEMGVIPTSREVAVEELINFHRHDIGRPRAGEAVLMDLRWRSEMVANEGVLQIGFATALANDKEQLRPLNLSLVIDKSGSMAANDKLSRVKEALKTMVGQLRPVDTLSVVTFDSEAAVLISSRKVTEPDVIKQMIDRIQPGSSTNIHSGLILGYKEALKNYSKDSTNRVVLLTDGIANQGVTEPAEIAKDSLGYNDRGIDLSTIGVGLDLNKDLLRELAKSGRGLFHFVGEQDDIKKVFIDELQSLIAPVATEPNLEVQFGPGAGLDKVYGYEPKIEGSRVKIKLDNMNSGLTQVVMIKFRGSGTKTVPVTARLSYYDIARKKQVVKTAETTVTFGSRAVGADDPEVSKNYTIAQVAQAIHDMAVACEKEHFREGETILVAAIGNALDRYPNLQDPDIRRNVEMAQRYRGVLHKQNALYSEDEGPNLITNGDFSGGNVGFTTALGYALPEHNVLWAHGFTIAPRFNNPQLHTLVPAEPYSSPLARKGNEQVMFANAGGSDLLLMWQTTVKVQPHTRYAISFMATSLSAGQEWVPSYEIRVNDFRSDPQLSAMRTWVPISTVWDSGSAHTATVSIYRLPLNHNGGVVGLAAVKMVALKKAGL